MSTRILACLFGLCIGNCLYQAFHAQAWARAGEISFFQALALLAVWLSIMITPTQDEP